MTELSILLGKIAVTLGLLSSALAAVPAREYNIIADTKTIVAEVTAYSSSPDETWGDGTISADGNKVYKGLIACPRRYDFGTLFEIEGRTYRCGDWLAKRYDERFDVWMESKKEALEWGIKEIEVKEVGHSSSTLNELVINRQFYEKGQ